MSVGPENGRNRYGPRNDGTYIVEFKTAGGEALAINVPVGGNPRAEALPGANAFRVVRAGSGRGLIQPGAAGRDPFEKNRQWL